MFKTSRIPWSTTLVRTFTRFNSGAPWTNPASSSYQESPTVQKRRSSDHFRNFRKRDRRERGFSDRERGFSDREKGFSDRERGYDRERGFSDRERGFSDRERGYQESPTRQRMVQKRSSSGPFRKTERDFSDRNRRLDNSSSVFPSTGRSRSPRRLSRYSARDKEGLSQSLDSAEQSAVDREEEAGDGRKQWVKSVFRLRQEKLGRQLQSLARKSQMTEAMEVLQKMKDGKLKPDVVTYNSIIAGLGKLGEFKKAFKLFNELKKRRLLPTDRTYSSMFAACGTAGPQALEILGKVRSEMERREVPLNTITANALMSALAMCGQHQEATQVYMDMEKLDIKPDVYTFGSLMLIMSRDKDDGVGVARGVWSEMRKSAVVPDLHCHNTILQVLRDGGLQGVVSELNHTPNQPAKVLEVPSVTAENIKQLVINVPTGKKEEASHKISEGVGKLKSGGKGTSKDATNDAEKAKNAQTSSGTVSMAVPDVERKVDGKWKQKYTELHERLGEIEKPVVSVKGEMTFELSRAHRLVLKVGGCQVKGHPGTIRWLEKSSMEDFFAYMKKNRVKPNIHSFHLLGHLATDPVHLLVTMQERKVMPDAKLMTAMVMQHSKYFHNLQAALAILEYCKWVGLDLGQAGYQAMAAGCVEKRSASVLLEKMTFDGVEPGSLVMGTLIGHAVRDHSYEYLTHLIRIMMHRRTQPNEVILQMLETAAAREPKSERQKDRLNGFKGFYNIWRKRIDSKEKKEPVPEEEKEHEEEEEEQDYVVV